jgi:hypothetical protein
MRRKKQKVKIIRPTGWLPATVSQTWEVITERGKILAYLEGTYTDVQIAFLDLVREHDKATSGVHLFRKGYGKPWAEKLKAKKS